MRVSPPAVLPFVPSLPFAFAALTAIAAIAAPAARAPAQTPVLVGAGASTVRSNLPWERGVAVTADGSLWAPVWENDGSGLPTAQHLWLYRSLDSGATWQQVTDTPTLGDSRGVLVGGTDCDTLHVAWSANPSGVAYDLYWQTFDVATLQWNGTPTRLLQGTNANDQYYATDVERTDQGTIAIAFHCHRTPVTPGLTAWSGALFVKRPADAQFQGPFRLNTDTYGMLPSLQAEGELLHASFRTNTGLYGIRYRAFDSASLQFATPADVPLYGASQSTMLATNTSCMAADRDGNRYVLFNTGAAAAPGSGEIRIAYSPAGSTTWTHQLVAQDPDLTAGNVTYTHFALATAGDEVYAVYSKRTVEQYSVLYLRIFSGGVAVTPEVPVATGVADEFASVTGSRSGAVHSGPFALTSGTPAAVPQGQVSFVSLGGLARTVRFGTSCQGGLPALPRLRSATLPALGGTFALELDRLPAATFGLVFAGGTCQRPPLPLQAIGMSGCFLWHDVVATLGFVTDAAGAATLPIALPANPAFADTRLYFGTAALAPGANAAGAITTNSLLAWFR